MEDKYHLPWTHEAFQDVTIFEALVWFYEDYYLKNPKEAHRTEDGEIFFQTGDPMIDKWEREIAQGLEPDLLEGLPAKWREKERKADERLLREAKQGSEFEGFNDDYTKMPLEMRSQVLGNKIPIRRGA